MIGTPTSNALSLPMVKNYLLWESSQILCYKFGIKKCNKKSVNSIGVLLLSYLMLLLCFSAGQSLYVRFSAQLIPGEKNCFGLPSIVSLCFYCVLPSLACFFSVTPVTYRHESGLKLLSLIHIHDITALERKGDVAARFSPSSKDNIMGFHEKFHPQTGKCANGSIHTYPPATV